MIISRIAPPKKMDRPAPVACAAPQTPSANPRPAAPGTFMVIAAVKVATAKVPPPSPIKKAPEKNKIGEPKTEDKRTAAKAKKK